MASEGPSMSKEPRNHNDAGNRPLRIGANQSRPSGRRSHVNPFTCIQDEVMTDQLLLMEPTHKSNAPPQPSNNGASTAHVLQQLESQEGIPNSSGIPMNWSPGRYGRYPSTKRGDRDESSSNGGHYISPYSTPNQDRGAPRLKRVEAEDQPNNTALSSHNPQSNTQADSPMQVRVIYDKPLVEAFAIIQKFREQGGA
jgi:hypothetical protein